MGKLHGSPYKIILEEIKIFSEHGDKERKYFFFFWWEKEVEHLISYPKYTSLETVCARAILCQIYLLSMGKLYKFQPEEGF